MCVAPLASAMLWLTQLPINDMVRALESEALTAKTEHGNMIIMQYVQLVLGLVTLLPTASSHGLRAHLVCELKNVDDLAASIEVLGEIITSLRQSDGANTEALDLLSRSFSALRWPMPYWHRLIDERIRAVA